MIPKDPAMLLSYVNMKLRDYYDNIDSMCSDLAIEKEELLLKLAVIDYHYDAGLNKFI